MAALVIHMNDIGAISGTQSHAQRCLGCISLIPKILSFWLLPGIVIRLGQAPAEGLGVPGMFLGDLLRVSLGGPWKLHGGVPQPLCNVY